jgi:4-amino-4-deoxy-L-arabinose transferase-like glycosyltransferase
LNWTPVADFANSRTVYMVRRLRMATTILEQPVAQTTETASTARLWARLFWTWLPLRTLIWTVFASLTQPNAPLDLIEWLAWGREWQWGYHKHPPLPAWIAETFFQLAGGRVWGVYLASYLCTALCLWCVWRLGCLMATPRRALLAALALDGLIFFNYDTAEFSNNVVLNATWALTILCFYHAVRSQRWRWWIMAGVVFGLGLLCKYTMAVVLAPLLFFVVWRPETRTRRTLAGICLMGATTAVVFFPHFVWMMHHDFMTITYGLERSASERTLVTHIKNPLLFSLSQIGRLLPVLAILVPLAGWRWRMRRAGAGGRFNRDYLLFAVLGPVALLLSMSLATGAQLREIWGSPLWTFAPLLALLALRINESPTAWQWSRRVWGVVAVGFLMYGLVKNYGEPYWSGRPGRMHFPGKQLAAEATRRYTESVGEPFPVAAGECWLAGNVSCYAPQRPSMYSSGSVGYCNFEPRTAPWLTEDEIRVRGGVFLWNAAEEGDELPAIMRVRFPHAETQPPIVLPYSGFPNLPPARIGLAFQKPMEIVR